MRPLPQAREAEAAVVAAVLLRGEAALLEVLDLVTEVDFHEPAFAAVFRAARTVAERGAPIDPVTVEAQLRAADELGLLGEGEATGIEALARLVDRYASARNARHHAEQVRAKALARQTVAAAESIAEEGRADPQDVPAYLDAAEARILELGRRGGPSRYRSGRELMLAAVPRLRERTGGAAVTGVATGYADLDHMLGGLQPGDLVVVGARPSMGKTAFALNVAEHAAILPWRDALATGQDRAERLAALEPCLFLSLEMSEAQLSERLIASQARIDGQRIRAGQFFGDDWERIISAGGRIAESPFYVDDTASPTILELRARARRWRADRRIFPEGSRRRGVVVVDYLQLVRGGAGRYQSREVEVAEVSRGLKALAKETACPVVVLCQLNREVDQRADHRPQLSDLRESGAIEQDADVVMFVHRPERYVHDPEKLRQVEGQAEIIVAKQRNGPIGSVALTYLKHLCRFEPASRG